MTATALQTLIAGDVPIRIARPGASAPSAAVLILHQATGFSAQTSEWLIRLADRGFLAVAPLLLHRQGVESVDPFKRFGGDFAEFDKFLPGDEQVLADADETLRFVEGEGIESPATAVMGFSYGGRAAYLAATQRELAGAVSFYGNGIYRKSFLGNEHLPALVGPNNTLRTPWLGLYGENDPLLGQGELDEWQLDLHGSAVPAELIRYEGAGHAFDVDAEFIPGMPSPYHAGAAEDANARALKFLDEHLR